MMTEASQIAPAPAHLEFAERAAQLGVDCWCVNLSLAITARPASANQVDDAAIIAAATSATKNPAVHDLIGLPDENGSVVISLSSDQTALQRKTLVQVLTHYHADLSRTAIDQRAIEGFNVQLSQSYEEVNLIFRMSKCLADSSDPRRAVETMCHELRAVLAYGWVAVVFQGGESVLTPLQDALIHSGDLPCTPAEITAHSALINAAAGRVLVPGRNDLATRAQSEVLVEGLTHGTVPIGILLAGNRRGLDPDVSSNELQLIDAMVGFLELYHQNAFRFAEQRRGFLGTLHALTAAVDAKDPYTHGHSERVGLLAAQLARVSGSAAEVIEATRVAGLLHDIGKIGVPEAILTKPARLTDEEFEVIKRHPVIGHQILSEIPSLAFQLPGVLYHHERWDGRGYPHKLQAEQIPMVARMLALADSFDAMSSNRAYRNAMNRARVLEEIRKSSGLQFDPQLVEPFVTMDFTEFDKMLNRLAGAAMPALAA